MGDPVYNQHLVVVATCTQLQLPTVASIQLKASYGWHGTQHI